MFLLLSARGVGIMYQNKKHLVEASFMDIDDLDVYNRWLVEEQIENDVLRPTDGAVLRGYFDDDEY